MTGTFGLLRNTFVTGRIVLDVTGHTAYLLLIRQGVETMTNWTATVTKTAEAQPCGTYVPTSIDARKAAADFLIVETGRTYILRASANAPALSGRGVKVRRPGLYEVTEGAMGRIRAAHNVMTDF